MNNCEHKNKMSLMYCNWCKDCGALEYLFGASPDWQLPTRTPEPTKAEKNEDNEESGEKSYWNTGKPNTKAENGLKEIVDAVADSYNSLEGEGCADHCRRIALTVFNRIVTPSITKENGLVRLDEKVMEAVIWQFFNPEAGTVRKLKDWAELSKHICTRFGVQATPSITKAENGLDKLKVAIIIQQNLRHADILPKGSVDCISLKDAEHIAHKICQTFATPSITKKQLLAILPELTKEYFKKGITHADGMLADIQAMSMEIGHLRTNAIMKQRIEEL